jgi:TatD DNase family protein
MPRLVDSHLHLQDPAFAADREKSLDAARAAGVGAWAVNGTSPEDWTDVASLTRKHTDLIPSFGLHPWYVNAWKSRDWQTPLAGHLHNENAAVGEIGLDRWIQDFDMDAQVHALRWQLGLARDLARPVSLHCLRAWDPLLLELQRVTPLARAFLIHGYGGPADLLSRLLCLGGYISFAGAALDERRTQAHAALRAVPADRLLVETDAPDMPPPAGFRVAPQVLYQGRYRNEPANLPRIVIGLARLRQEDPETLRHQLAANAQRFWEGFL